jgi:hypothetical protein
VGPIATLRFLFAKQAKEKRKLVEPHYVGKFDPTQNLTIDFRLAALSDFFEIYFDGA